MNPDAPPPPVTGGDEQSPLLEVDHLRVWFPVRRGLLRRRAGWAKAVDDVTFSLARGRTMALVGESGAGKTTTGRAVVRIQTVTAGSIRFKGESLTNLHGSELRRKRRQLRQGCRWRGMIERQRRAARPRFAPR